jgi:integrase
MLLSEAIAFTFENREAWATGKGAITARINSNHCLAILGDIPVEEIESKHYAKITKALKEKGRKPGTINRVLAALSAIINELRQHGYKLDEPVHKRQREPKGRLEFYSHEDIDKLLEAALTLRDNYLMFDSIMFASKTGCRQGEMLKLTIDDIDLETNQITFRDVKTSGDHIIPMHTDLEEVMERRLECVSCDGLIFPWDNKDTLLRTFRKVQALAGVDQSMNWHHIIHTTATWLVEKDVPLKVIMSVLNHSNINTTLRYAHAMDKSVKSAIELL